MSPGCRMFSDGADEGDRSKPREIIVKFRNPKARLALPVQTTKRANKIKILRFTMEL